MSAQGADVDGNLPQSQSALTSFFMAVSMIGVSEIGDKTFLIAALMAMRHPRWLVFSAASASLAIMTILSGLVGHTFVSIISERYTRFLAGILFLVFGYKLTLEGLEMSKDAGVEDELAEVEEEIAVHDLNTNMQDMESGGIPEEKHSKRYDLKSVLKLLGQRLSIVFSPIWIQIFSMIFLGEFGDRSQISIIAMASDSDYWFVIIGAVVGHLLCSCVAVIGGRFLASKISMRTVTLGGAFSFFIFAVHYIYDAFNTV
ncbi:GDT1 (YBR187W) [Zygosaccharomyces parabailii]|nr:GDT1 (YBR187W) [Zygosaccharomyces parabailii]CDH14820.1 related to GDT1-like protein 4 [Zygosaccharomyces bailii ISA1307]SJM81840.1 related to GCR1-dependent translation factor 1 [Zygosaccharomyces bailii]